MVLIKIASEKRIPFRLSDFGSLTVRLGFHGTMINTDEMNEEHEEAVKQNAVSKIENALNHYSGQVAWKDMGKLAMEVSKEVTQNLRANGINYTVQLNSFHVDEKTEKVIRNLEEAERVSKMSPEERAKLMEQKMREAQAATGMTSEQVMEQMKAVQPEGQEIQRPRFCGNCGKPLNPTARFCGNCGARL